MYDFKLIVYKHLLKSFIQNGFLFQTLENIVQYGYEEKTVVLRHDVDCKPKNALNIALVEKEFDIKASYYFRIVKESYDRNIINKIVKLGHEIGYHYEDLSLSKGNYERGIKNFKKNLGKLREIYPIKTICMHGSPLSKYDNRDLWKKYDYRDYGIVAEPYFDVDFNEVLYLTDTGRRWDGDKYAIRDKVEDTCVHITELCYGEEDSKQSNKREEEKKMIGLEVKKWPKFHSTFDIIEAAEKGLLPDKIMINTHPQRWTDKPLPWIKELVTQNIKNVAKRILNKISAKRNS